MAKPKEKPTVPLREPRPKKNLGLTVPPALRLPHEELVKPPDTSSDQDKSTMTSLPSHTSQTSLSSHTSQTRQTSHTKDSASHPIAPDRDFTKVANSITRAIPEGVFLGKSKQLYDYLYSVTRGAVVPSRSIRLPRPKLMKAAGIGSRVTFDANIQRLSQAGLIQVQTIAGEHRGNEYTVFLPEEVGLSMTSMTSHTSHTSYAQKLDRLVIPVSRQTSHSLSTEESTVSEEPKTSFKTIHDDDDGTIEFAVILRQAACEVLGYDLPQTLEERARWKECAELLAGELKLAAGRAETISSVPAFFAAHLRRRFKNVPATKSTIPSRKPVKNQASSLSNEQRIKKIIREIRMLHVGDSSYNESDLIDDLKYRCGREHIEWDEELINKLLDRTEDGEGK